MRQELEEILHKEQEMILAVQKYQRRFETRDVESVALAARNEYPEETPGLVLSALREKFGDL